jgi:hypothetical protein
MPEGGGGERRTRVLLQPNLNAASCANSSPKPSIMPLMKGKNRLMATPRMIDQIVGGLYNTTAPPLLPGEEDGEADRPSFWLAEYCSLSVRMVTPDSVIGFGGSSEDMIFGCERNSLDGSWWWREGDWAPTTSDIKGAMLKMGDGLELLMDRRDLDAGSNGVWFWTHNLPHTRQGLDWLHRRSAFAGGAVWLGGAIR